jgi:glycosyltransferase involved in cell wall biosynthesis
MPKVRIDDDDSTEWRRDASGWRAGADGPSTDLDPVVRTNATGAPARRTPPLIETQDRLRILLLAEACNPAWPGEPLIGYNLATALAARDELALTVVTQVRNKKALADDPLGERADVVYVESEFIAKPLFQLARFLERSTSVSWTVTTALAWPSYVVFEWMVYRRLRDRLRRKEFDLVHRITPISPGMAGPLASRVELPVLLGPLNGGLPWPRGHSDRQAEEGERVATWRRHHVRLPFYKSTLSSAAGLIAGSRYTAGSLPSDVKAQRFFMPENGVDPRRFPLADAWPEPKGRFRFVTVSRLVPVKAIDLVIEAMRESERLRACELRIVGNGPERDHLEAIVKDYGLQGSVEFLGWLDQTAVARELASAQAFVFPSVKDFGGGALFEAMSAGLPSIVVDYGGPGDLVTPDTGFRMPLRSRDHLIADLRAAMEALSGDLPLCRRMGNAAVKLIREQHTWDVKAAKLVEIYRTVAAS